MFMELCARAYIAVGNSVSLLPEYRALLPTALLILGTWLTVSYIQCAYFTRLWEIPGPLLNSFTNMLLNYHIATGNYHQYTEELHSKYGPVVRVGYNQVSVSNLSELKRILSTHDFPKGSSYRKMKSLPPNTFFTADVKINKLRRRQLGNPYSLPSIRIYEDAILEHGVLSLISVWDKKIASSQNGNKALVNFYHGFHSMAFDIIGVLGFGKSFNIVATGSKELTESVANAFKLSVIRAGVPLGRHIQWLFRTRAGGLEYILTSAAEMIKKRRQENADAADADAKGEDSKSHFDILQRLIDARDPLTGAAIDDKSLVAEIFLLLVGGTDTISNTLGWTTLCLLHRPDVYERLKNDIRTTFPDKSTVVRYDMARTKLPYLIAVLYESMRLHPAVAGYMPRYVPEQGAHLMNGKYFLPPGTEIGVPIFSCNRNKETWSNRNEFDPERFMGPGSEERFKDVLTFSSGVRMCAGIHFSMAEMCVALANLILRYDLKLPDGMENCFKSVGEIPGKSYFNYGPTDPDKECWMIISPVE